MSDLGVVGIMLMIGYFIPLIVASARKHSKIAAIGVVNIFLGWTFIGWVIALAWACTENNQKSPVKK